MKYPRRGFLIEVDLPLDPATLPEDIASWFDANFPGVFIPTDSHDHAIKDLHGDPGCRVYEIAN